MQRKRIIVGTNTLTSSYYECYTNHCQFWFRLGRKYPDIDFIVNHPHRMSIDRMRNSTAKIAIEADCEYLLFIDDDVLIPPNDTLERLLNCNADIAAGNVIIRGYPFDYMVFRETWVERSLTAPVTLKAIKKSGKGVEDVDAVGFSCCLIKVSLLRKIPPPWFVTGPNFTEDIYFCCKARELFPETTIKVDWDLVCGHILWPEPIRHDVREEYKKYFEAVNPGAVDSDYTIKIYRDMINYEDAVKSDLERTRLVK